MKMHKRSDKVGARRISDFSACETLTVLFNHSDRAYITDDETKVTCKTCLKIMGKKK